MTTTEVELGVLINWVQEEFEREAIAVDRLNRIGQVLGGTPTPLPDRLFYRDHYRDMLVRLRELQEQRSED